MDGQKQCLLPLPYGWGHNNIPVMTPKITPVAATTTIITFSFLFNQLNFIFLQLLGV